MNDLDTRWDFLDGETLNSNVSTLTIENKQEWKASCFERDSKPRSHYASFTTIGYDHIKSHRSGVIPWL